jgi:hypothetical protein
VNDGSLAGIDRHQVGLRLNELAQGLEPAAAGVEWFGQLAPDSQRSVMRIVIAMAGQAHIVAEDGAFGARAANLKPRSNVARLLTEHPERLRYYKLALSPERDLPDAFAALLHAFARRDGIRRAACPKPCSHWWHHLELISAIDAIASSAWDRSGAMDAGASRAVLSDVKWLLRARNTVTAYAALCECLRWGENAPDQVLLTGLITAAQDLGLQTGALESLRS